MNKTFLVSLAIIVTGILGGFYIYTNNNKTENDASSSTGSTENSSNLGSGSNKKTADYSGKGLTEFPKEVLNQKDIVVLNLSNNNLTGAIPAEIKNLTNLEELNLSNNNMTGIPAEIGQMKKLRILNYSNNQITGLPNELGNLTGLLVFDLSGNNPAQQDLSQIQAKLTNTQIKL